jgi:hypothetical protein
LSWFKNLVSKWSESKKEQDFSDAVRGSGFASEENAALPEWVNSPLTTEEALVVEYVLNRLGSARYERLAGLDSICVPNVTVIVGVTSASVRAHSLSDGYEFTEFKVTDSAVLAALQAKVDSAKGVRHARILMDAITEKQPEHKPAKRPRRTKRAFA